MPDSRYQTLIDVARTVYPLSGDWVEVGVYKGDSAVELAGLIRPPWRLWLYDTFTGHPAECFGDESEPGHKPGKYRDTNPNKVLERIRRAINPYCCACLVPAVFPHTASLPDRIALAHVDVDLYLSTRDALTALWPRITSGGALVCDDYGYGSCPGAKRAVDEFCEVNGIELTKKRSQAVLWKDRTAST